VAVWQWQCGRVVVWHWVAVGGSVAVAVAVTVAVVGWQCGSVAVAVGQ
jgi:hypothetical protein